METTSSSSIPLLRPDIARSKWVTLFACVDRAYCKRRFNRILLSRDPHEVNRAWTTRVVSDGRVRQACEILRDTCSWANSLFLPDDNAAIAFQLGSTWLEDVQAWNIMLSQGIIVPDVHSFDALPSLDLGELFSDTLRARE